DQQKGLVQSLDDLLPNAEHRKCARHVFNNWKVKHNHTSSRDAFWDAVYASNEVQFKGATREMEELHSKGEDPNVYDDFMK
ncbi:hypothetical protein LINPERPRIM_LOCUS33421, partial [Linum perenne]